MKRFSVYAAAVGLLAAAAVTGSAAAATAGTLGSCSAQGSGANCATAGRASHPVTFTVTVTSSPHQTVIVAWDMNCAQGSTTRSSSGHFTATTPLTRTIPHPFAQPTTCIAAAAAELSGSGTLHVSLAYSPVHHIKGYAGLCVDDKGNSTALRNKIEIWKCNGGASQQWAFSRGKLIHGGKCMNAKGSAGSPVVLYSCNGTANELWAHNSKGEYVLKAHGSTLCLTGPGFSKKNGTQLVVSACRNGANQHWSLP